MNFSLVHRFQTLLNEISTIACSCGRNPSDIGLIAVSKYHSWNEMKQLYELGQRRFGESRPQELLIKISETPQDIQWHFVGPLQKNKVRKLIGQASLIHSVDSLELAVKISTCSGEAGVISPILIQINTSGELSKQGVSAEECLKQADSLLRLPNLSIQGLMTMAPLTQDTEKIRSCFAHLRMLRETLQNHYGKITFPHLSMGMSNDYRIAIEEGATLLRIGSLLFKGSY